MSRIGKMPISVPQGVEVNTLIVQLILERGQVDLVLSQGGARQQHHGDQKQGNDFLHVAFVTQTQISSCLLLQTMW